MVAQSPMTDQLGPYRLLEKIGEGGMGVVHRALDPAGRAVAVKVLRPAVAIDPDARRRLGREFETMRLVRSRFVAEVIDADVTGDVPYVVTRYVAGPSLDQLVARDGPLTGRALERLAWGLAEGLAAVHAAGVIHRDLKPGNVVMAAGVPVLIDFGIAHVPDATRITQTGMFMGTPGYLAPEVVEGQPSGPSADVHSWASTVAFAATGRPPFGTGSYETIFYRIVGGQPDLAGVPAKLTPLLRAALARDPYARPTAMQLSAQCAAIDLSSPDAPPSGRPRRARFFRSSAPAAAGAAAGAAGAAAYGAAGAAAYGAHAAGVPLGAAPGTVVDGRPVAAPSPSRAGRGSASRARKRSMPAAAGYGDFADVLPPVRRASPVPSRYDAPVLSRYGGPAPGRYDAAVLSRYGGGAVPGRYDAAAAARYGAPPLPRPGEPAVSAAGRAAPASATGQAGAAGVRRLLALLTMAIGVAASVLLPVAGTIIASAAILLLRAADRAHGGLLRRRSERGARLSDVPVMVAMTPWALFRALVSSVLIFPLALLCGAAAAAVTVIATHANAYPTAGAYAAGAFVAFYAFGLGSGQPRRQLGRLFGVVARRRLPAALTVTLFAVLAAAVAVAAVTQPHHAWPLSPSLHLAGLHHLANQVAFRLRHL